MKTIGIYLFDNIEVLDFAGPFEVFSTAQRLHAMGCDNPADRLFEVVTIAEKPAEITARGGLKVLPMHGIEYHPHLDVLLVPGGVVAAEMKKENVLTWIRTTSERVDITASVCTGAFLLAQAGLLNAMEVTTHWEDIEELRLSFPEVVVKENTRWIDNGHIITSAGISAGIDMSLYLVSRLAGKDHAAKTARQMEYDWQGS